MKPRALILAFGEVGDDPRVDRQIRFLLGDFDVVVAALGPPRHPGVKFVPLPLPPTPRGLYRQARRMYRGALLLGRRYAAFHAPGIAPARAALRGVRADVVVANDIDALPLALDLGPPVVFDAHEYAPGELSELRRWRWLTAPYRTWLCREFMPRAAATMTVGPTIAEAYARLVGVRPAVVTNAPPRADLAPSRPGVGGRIRLVHHGVALPSRGLEVMLEAFGRLDERFELDLFLVAGAGHAAYWDVLRGRAATMPRVALREPVPMRELPLRLNEYDVGVYLLQPANFNNLHALPNKIFEFVQARLAIAVGPSPEMARLVQERGCGVVSSDFSAESFARAVGALDRPRVDAFKRAAHEAANDLCAEANRETFLELVRAALSSGRSALEKR